MMESSIVPSLQRALARHVPGIVHAILDGLCNAHSVTFEKAPHGMFFKCFYPTRPKPDIPDHVQTPMKFNITTPPPS